ncbi:MAG: hypothetical protein QOG73_2679 [Acetobacteraceae bacterium]|nr:hypothetical protein [Acetobacteraceae bacterium]
MPESTEAMAKQPLGHELYELDEHEWIAAQIAALTDGHLDRLDRANLIEFLTEMTIRDRRELQSRLVVLLQHLLKVQYQPEKLTRSWVTTIIEQQSEIRSIIESIPSLGRQADTVAAAAYPDAVRRAARETGLPPARFPSKSPWTVAAALAFDPPEPAARGKRHS